MEQRIGRIDRVRSQTDRRLSSLDREPAGDDWLQVYFPYLEDTVEVLQVERVLERTDTFLRLMHEGLESSATEQKRIDVNRAVIAARKRIDNLRRPLKSAFPVPERALRGSKESLVVADSFSAQVRTRFLRLADQLELGGLPTQWAMQRSVGMQLGTVRLPNGRIQPFTLVLRSDHGTPIVRCISPVGRTFPDEDPQPIVERAARVPSRVGAIFTRDERSYDLTVEDDVLLGGAEHDAVRVGLLLRRVTEQADRMEQEHYEDGRDAALASAAA